MEDSFSIISFVLISEKASSKITFVFAVSSLFNAKNTITFTRYLDHFTGSLLIDLEQLLAGEDLIEFLVELVDAPAFLAGFGKGELGMGDEGAWIGPVLG